MGLGGGLSVKRLRPIGAVAALAVVAAMAAEAGGKDDPRVVRLIKGKQYRDAIKLLVDDVAGRRAQDCGRQHLLLGECHYLLKKYARSRPHFVKARTYVKADADRTIAEYRLACVAYRTRDYPGAAAHIDGFLDKHPRDRRVGTLLLFKMKILSRRGAAAVKELEPIHKRLSADRAKYGYSAAFMADKLLSDAYIQAGEKEKAKELYARIVHQFRGVIAEYTTQKRPIPEEFQRSHDEAALQLGIIAFQDKQPLRATIWLENVRYDLGTKTKARLLLAQIAYQAGQFEKAQRILTADNFIDLVPAGKLRSDMYLLLALCEKQKERGKPSRVEGYLRKVGPDSTGFAQARFTLGNLYRERGLVREAIKAYLSAKDSPKYAADALFYLGSLYMEQAESETVPKKRDALYRDASNMFNRLISHHPLCPHIKRAGELARVLRAKGFDVVFAAGDRDKVAEWERIARTQAGTPGGSAALLNLARYHFKEVADEKTDKTVKAPHYPRCVSYCEKFLTAGGHPATGPAEKRWQRFRCEVLLMRAQAELASAFPAPPKRGSVVRTTYLPRADVAGAIRHFESARKIVDPKDREMVKSIDLGLIEAMFKSKDKPTQAKARQWFAKLVNDYGTDPRFQKLATDLAEWYRKRGRYPEAAREYRGIADRGKGLPRETLLKTLYLAGSLYSQAAYDAQNKPGQTRLAIYVHPKEEFRLGNLLKTYKPLQKTVTVTWPRQKPGRITRAEALAALSKASGVPFVWSPVEDPRGKGNIADWLAKPLPTPKGQETATVAALLGRILTPGRHRVAFDIGMTGGKPTIPPAPADPEDPEAEEPVRVIEIYDLRQEHTRYAPMARGYGTWSDVYGSGAEAKSVMLYSIVQRIEKVTETRFIWAEGIETERVLAAEYDSIPGVPRQGNCTCAGALLAVLRPRGLLFKIARRDLSADYYQKAKECFNEVCKIAPKSRYGERSLFALSLNYYHQKDFDRMKTVLKHYLKVFDNPSHPYYHRACFWVGWVFEHEKRYRDACRYYTLSAEEYLLVYKPGQQDERRGRQELLRQLSYDSRFALGEPVTGEFQDCRLEEEFADFIRQSTNLLLKTDPSAGSTATLIQRERFENVPCSDVLCDALAELGLSFRGENVDAKTAEKAYYRLASAYSKDGLMEHALESLNTLLGRFPATKRSRDALKLKLDVYKGLKDYRNVLDTLSELKKRFAGEIEPHKIDFEMAWIYFDLCHYPKAGEYFKKSLAAAEDPAERVNIRDGYARALFRAGRLDDALGQYRALVAEEPSPLRLFVDRLMVYYLKFALGKATAGEFPEASQKLVFEYEKLPRKERDALAKSDFARVTWIYYIYGLMDLRKARAAPTAAERASAKAAALKELQAAANSPDDLLAADALYRIGRMHLADGQYERAADTFEYALFATKSAEAEIKATYHLGLCYQKLGKIERAKERFRRLLTRFRDSAYAERARKDPLYEQMQAEQRPPASGPASGPARSPAGAKNSPPPDPAKGR